MEKDAVIRALGVGSLLGVFTLVFLILVMASHEPSPWRDWAEGSHALWSRRRLGSRVVLLVPSQRAPLSSPASTQGVPASSIIERLRSLSFNSLPYLL